MADKKYSELDQAGNLTGNETFSILQVGKNVRTTLSIIKDWIASTLSFDSITLNTDPPVVTDAGTIIWNKNEYTIDIITGLGATIQVGQETLVLVYNNTGGVTSNGKILHPIGAFESGDVGITYELADASHWETCQGTLIVATHDIPNNSFGLATRFGKVRGLNTSSFTGKQLWLTDDGSGDFTETRPVFPSYAISMGGSIKIDAADGEIFVSVLGTENDTYNDGWDGAIRETFDFTTSSNGTVITGLLKNADPTQNLTLLFSDGFYTLDTTTAPLTITLTAGTDGNETTNYVYIPKSTKALTVSTSGFPSAEHARIAIVELQSAATTQADGGALGNQNTNDHIKTTNDNGHILHIAAWIRKQFSTFESGTEATFDNTGGNGYINITSGVANQLHEQALSSFSMPTNSIRVWNHEGGLRPKITNLTSITTYSDGSTWNNEWAKIVVWRVVNKTGEYAPVMLNKPSGGYNSEANALEDLERKADYSIPNNFKTKAILIGAFVYRISGGVITYNTGYQDLRGQIPITVAGGGSGSGGVTTLLALTDVLISTYTGIADYKLKVNSGETGVEAYDDLLNNINDVDTTGKSDGDLLEYNSTSGNWEVTPTATFGQITNSLEANLSANGQLSTIIPAGYKIDTITVTETAGNAAGNISIGTSALGTQVVNAFTVGASSDLDMTLVSGGEYQSRTTDTDLYVSSSAWGTGVITLYFTFKKV